VSAAAPITIREATAADAAALGRLGAALTRLHYGWDRERFITPAPNLEEKVRAISGLAHRERA
jgi:hypothetical protein